MIMNRPRYTPDSLKYTSFVILILIQVLLYSSQNLILFYPFYRHLLIIALLELSSISPNKYRKYHFIDLTKAFLLNVDAIY